MFKFIQDRSANVLTGNRSATERWKEWFKELMHKENERQLRLETITAVDREIAEICTGKVKNSLKRLMSGRAIEADVYM